MAGNFNIEETETPISPDKWEAKLDESIDKKIKKWALFGAWVLISVILGYIVATVWDLNGKIYEVAGKQSIQYETIKELNNRNTKLSEENSALKEQILNIKMDNIKNSKGKK